MSNDGYDSGRPNQTTCKKHAPNINKGNEFKTFDDSQSESVEGRALYCL